MDGIMMEDIREREYQRVYAQVELDAIEENVYRMKNGIAPGTRLIAVIKADGYGHGAVPVAHLLEPLAFVSGFAVATAQEAHILRMAGIKKPILILGYTFPCDYELLIREDLTATVFREDTIEALSAAACRAGKRVRVHVKVDTGMNRIGIAPDAEGLAFVRRLSGAPGIEIEGIFTHFARADETDKTSAMAQFTLFQTFVDRIEREIQITIPVKHCANSAGILELPQTGMDAVRAGIAMYGLSPSEEVDGERAQLIPALSLHSRVIYVKPLRAGQSVSYGGIFTAQKDMKIATIPVGYGDGYPRSLSGKGYVLIRGKRAYILGRVCMDQFMVDVTDIEGACEGDPVTLIGVDGEESISAEELGELSGRFNYELVCNLGKRIPRVYVRGGLVAGAKDYFGDFE